jgi:hypothetical protein
MRFILRVREKSSYPRYIYTVEDDTGKVYAQRKSDRKYVACLMSKNPNHCPSIWTASTYFGRLDLVNKGWNKSTYDWFVKNKWESIVVYSKESIENIVQKVYHNEGIQEAINEADKHATTVNKYCSGCDNYYPTFKDEKFCLICGGAHTNRKDPDLSIPLENLTDEDEENIVPDGTVSGAELPTILVVYGGIVQGATNLT